MTTEDQNYDNEQFANVLKGKARLLYERIPRYLQLFIFRGRVVFKKKYGCLASIKQTNHPTKLQPTNNQQQTAAAAAKQYKQTKKTNH